MAVSNIMIIMLLLLFITIIVVHRHHRDHSLRWVTRIISCQLQLEQLRKSWQEEQKYYYDKMCSE